MSTPIDKEAFRGHRESMSERMTDEEYRAKRAALVFGDAREAMVFLEEEATRARASEVAKDAEIEALRVERSNLKDTLDWTAHGLAEWKAESESKDAVIKALADALSPTAPENVDGPCWCRPGLKARGNEGDHGRTCQSRRAALRRAGRL